MSITAAEYQKLVVPKTNSKNKVAESHVVKACIDWLFGHGIFCWRNNTGAYKSETGAYIRYGKKGSPDIIGVNPAGKFIGVECKSNIGSLADDQRDFGERIIRNGGIYIVARGVDDLEHYFKSRHAE